MSADFEIVLDECLAQLEKGENFDAGLGDHAAMADELRPLLALAAGLRAAPAPRANAQAMADGKQKMLAAFTAQSRRQRAPMAIFDDFALRIRAFLRLGKDTDAKYVLRFAVSILLVLVFGTSGVLAASKSSLPGDTLYPVKQSVEGLRLSLTLDGQARQTLADQLNAERLQEIQRLLALHRQGIVEFDGLLQAQDGKQWTVSGLALYLSDTTTIEGWPAVGTRIRVLLQVGGDGTLTALRVRQAGSGPDVKGGGFVSPLSSPSPVPTGTPMPTERQNSTPQPGTRTQDGPMSTDWQTYEPWSGDWQTHEPMPTSWLGHDDMSGTGQTDHAMATAWPTHDSMSTDHANPTARPTRSSMLTPQPPHQPMPTQPSHQWMPTSEPPHHDGGSMPTQPPHRDYQPGGGGSESDGQH